MREGDQAERERAQKEEELLAEEYDETTGSYYRICSACDLYRSLMEDINRKLRNMSATGNEGALRERLRELSFELLEHQRVHS